MPPPILFPSSLEKFGPKHSTSVPSSAEVAVPLSVDEKKAELVPNPVSGLALKALLDPHVDEAPAVLCARIHSLLPLTLQMVTPFVSPVTLQVKVKASPAQVGGATMNCPATPGEIKMCH